MPVRVNVIDFRVRMRRQIVAIDAHRVTVDAYTSCVPHIDVFHTQIIIRVSNLVGGVAQW